MSVKEAFEALPLFVSQKKTAEFLGVSRTTVKRYVDAGDLKLWKLESGRKKVSKDSIAKLCGIKQ